MTISFNKRDPIYVQVVQDFKQKIVSGQLKPGQEVPSRRELAASLKINPNTVQRAYKEMEEEGLLHTEGNLPSKITENSDALVSLRKTLIQQAVDTFVAAVKSVNVPPQDVLKLVEERLSIQQNDGRSDQ